MAHRNERADVVAEIAMLRKQQFESEIDATYLGWTLKAKLGGLPLLGPRSFGKISVIEIFRQQGLNFCFPTIEKRYGSVNLLSSWF